MDFDALNRRRDFSDWKWQLAHRIRLPADLPEGFSLTNEEREFFSRYCDERKGLPAVDTGVALDFAVTPYYFSLAEDSPDDPIRRQFLPRSEEFVFRDYELGDPLGESDRSPVPGLVHRYADRALLLVTDSCAVYCRHCFRRTHTGGNAGAITAVRLGAAAVYLSEHPEIQELLLSGGDPLILGDGKLLSIFEKIRAQRPDMIFRVGTRIPVVLPQRITPELSEILGRFAPLWIVTHFNHPTELSHEAEEALARLAGAGIPVLNQSVLLAGVNDSVETLEGLFRALVRNRVKPYYLFQGDLAAGTSHLRTPIERGLSIMRELRKRLSGIALPVFALDLPGGGGKVPLTENYLEKETDEWLTFRSIDGGIYRYPRE